MFRPHFGICTCHNKKRLIVVKSGLCKTGNDEKKGINRTGNNRQGLSSTVGNTQRKYPDRRNGLHRKQDINDQERIREDVSIGKTSAFKIKTQNKKRGKIKYMRRNTGEAQVFTQMFEKSAQANDQEGCKCSVCDSPIGSEPYTWMFSHVLAKSTFGAFRLWPRNIWICCLSCHGAWGTGSRLGGSFREKRKVSVHLKQFYYWLTRKNRMTSDPNELEMLFKIFENE